MTDLLAARGQMAVSLAFHILFAVVGIGMPALMVLAERRFLVTRDPLFLLLAKRWAKGTAILFAVGAVSGTVLSFELGLLWPRFMEFAGPIIGMPFGLEGFAFFAEAIFLGVYLYGWDRISPRAHWWAGVAVAVSGAASGVFVVIANAWMNSPTGFTLVDGMVRDVDPLAAMTNPMAVQQTLHMTLAAYAATGMAVAGIHAALLRRGRDVAFHRAALRIALLVGVPASLLQPLSGHFSAQRVAERQPVKLAALEGQFRTERRAPLRIGGIPDEAREETRWALEVPAALSFLAFNDVDAEVAGLDRVPRADRPPVLVTHLAFQVMVGLGTVMALLGVLVVVGAVRGRPVAEQPRLLRALAWAAPAGFVAIEAGWTVTEVGRQPWVVYGVVRTAEAVTPMPGLVVPFVGFTVLYILLGIATAYVLWTQVIRPTPTPRASRQLPTLGPLEAA